MTTPRQHRRLAERGRRLASQREDLIASGADPADLPIPLHPDPPAKPKRRRSLRVVADQDPQAAHYNQLARAYLLAAAACLGAASGCVGAMGAGLTADPEPTWQTWLAAGAALAWGGFMVWAAAYAGHLRNKARGEGPA